MTTRTDDLLAAGSAGALGGVTALGVWELTAAPPAVAALAAGLAGLALHLGHRAAEAVRSAASDE